MIQDLQVNDFEPIHVYAYVCPHGSTLSCITQTGNVTKSSTSLFGVIDLEGVKDNCKNDITFSLEYKTGLKFIATDSHILSNSLILICVE